jgi:hypothetical protein
MGILNSLSILDSEEDPVIPRAELVQMARQNANRLNRTLAALLDLAQLESGVFHARLREIDFAKTVRNRVDTTSRDLREEGLKTRVTVQGKGTKNPSILADPQKVSRAVDLCLQSLVKRAESGSTVEAVVSGSEVEIKFKIKAESRESWEQAWLQAQSGFQGGVASPSSAFGGVLQSEEAFLTRKEEGLGSEFLLVHEIMRLHGGKFTMQMKASDVSLVLAFSQVSSEEGVRAVLMSRAYDVSTELGSVALVLMEAKGMPLEDFAAELRQHLFRATDAVYPLPERKQIALVLDDCKSDDVPRLIDRLKKSLSGVPSVSVGWAHCPADGFDPSMLYDLAQTRI